MLEVLDGFTFDVQAFKEEACTFGIAASASTGSEFCRTNSLSFINESSPSIVSWLEYISSGSLNCRISLPESLLLQVVVALISRKLVSELNSIEPKLCFASHWWICLSNLSLLDWVHSFLFILRFKVKLSFLRLSTLLLMCLVHKRSLLTVSQFSVLSSSFDLLRSALVGSKDSSSFCTLTRKEGY